MPLIRIEFSCSYFVHGTFEVAKEKIHAFLFNLADMHDFGVVFDRIRFFEVDARRWKQFLVGGGWFHRYGVLVHASVFFKWINLCLLVVHMHCSMILNLLFGESGLQATSLTIRCDGPKVAG